MTRPQVTEMHNGTFPTRNVMIGHYKIHKICAVPLSLLYSTDDEEIGIETVKGLVQSFPILLW